MMQGLSALLNPLNERQVPAHRSIEKAHGSRRGLSLSQFMQALRLKLPQQIVRAGDLKATPLLNVQLFDYAVFDQHRIAL